MTDLFNLQNQVALVTGASSGLGSHFARVLADAGAAVILAARRLDRIEALSAEINAGGGRSIAVALDVSDRASCEQAVAASEAAFSSITILVNNAGVADEEHFTATTEEGWNRVMNINMKGIWLLSRLVVERLVKQRLEGSIINVASILGFMADSHNALYCTSKGGVIQLTKAMAVDLYAQGIRVNALCPGYFSSEMTDDFLENEEGKSMIQRTPAQRPGRYEELSGPLLLLASSASSFMNGALLTVDGGHSIKLT